MGEWDWAARIQRVLGVVVGLSLLAALIPDAVSSAHAAVQINEVRINEVVTSNSSHAAADGSSPDWIEVMNPGPNAVDLTDWALTDDPTRAQKWVFPAGTSIPGGATLVIFASGSGVAQDAELHANFSLSSDEFVGLANPAGTIVHEIEAIPELADDASWGIDDGGNFGYFATATPGAPNGSALLGRLEDVVATPGRGFFDANVSVTLNAGHPNATIRYTTDGSAPTTTRGTVYSGPIQVNSTTILRAYAYLDGWESRRPVTHTYIYPADVPNQPRMVAGVVNANRANIEAGIESIPVISLVSNVSPGAPRWTFGSRVATTVEMIFPDGSEGFQVDAAANEVGNTSVQYPKDSLRLVFGSDWGESELDFPVFDGADNPARPATDEFKRLTLRMGSHDSGFYQRSTAPHRAFVRARLHDEAMLDLGHVNSHGRFVNVFLNGQYWGQYHLREHLDDHFMASYFGGDNEEYLGVNWGRVAVGAGTSWDAVNAASTSWSDFSQWVDPVGYVDFMLVTEYGGNTWDLRYNANWRGAGPATTPGDAHYVFQNSDPDIALVSTTARTPYSGPANSWHRLIAEADPEFMTLVNDRIHALLRDDGALTHAATQARLAKLEAQIDGSSWAEWARWNVMSKTALTTALNWFKNTLFAQRPNNLLGLLNTAGLVSPLNPAAFAQSGEVPAREFVAVSNPNGSGTVYMTIDGTDPRLPGGGLAASARPVGGQLRIDHDMTVTHRVRDGATWSAVETTEFIAVPHANAPVVDLVPDLVDIAGFATGYAIDATDPNDAAMVFSASELPAGLTIDPGTGVIAGTPTVPFVSPVVVNVSNGAHATAVAFDWEIKPAAVPALPVPLVLNEFNAVQAESLLADGGADVRFGRIAGNGGDWLELLVTEDGTDLRGWTVELSSRKDGEVLSVADSFTFSQAGVLADLRAGTLITIAEDGLENLDYDPDANDWHIAAIARAGYDSQLIAQPASDFDTNRHEFRIRVIDASGNARSPYMGETDHWDSVNGNVSGVEVMALCTVPYPDRDPIGVYDDVKATSTFGAANACGDQDQALLFLRGGVTGDVNCDTLVTDFDAQLLLEALAGARPGDGRCPDRGEAVATYHGDMNNDGTVNLLDALLIAQGQP